jgi:hypothetical protein
VLLAVTVDTECDKGAAWKTQHPLRFRSVTEGIPDILEPLFRTHGIVPTYLLSPEILRDPSSVALLRGLKDCELGTHLHGEFIEPEADLAAAVTSVPQSAYAPAVEREKLKNLTALFADRLGFAPKSFRGGRFALSSHTLGFLEELGYSVDSTVTPFRTNAYDGGRTCNYWGAPLAPYHPSRKDPRKRGSLGLLEVPVTILMPFLARLPSVFLRRLSDRAFQSGLGRALGKASRRKIWVRPLRGTAEELASGADVVVSGWDPRSPAVINIMFHSVEVIPGASPYAGTPAEVQRLVDGLDHLFAHLKERYAVVATGLAGVAQRWAA